VLVARQIQLSLSKFLDNTRPLNNNNDLQVELKLENAMIRQTVQLFDLSLMCKHKNTLFASTNPNTVLCDSAVVVDRTLYLFQATIGASHSISQKGISHYFNQNIDNQVDFIKLIYIIPELLYFNELTKKDFSDTQDKFSELSGNFEFCIYLTEFKPKRYSYY
jgi:hypothetical protein